MRKLIKLLIVTLIGIITLNGLVYGEETNLNYDSTLNVDVINDEGIRILTKEGEIIYSNSPLSFLIEESAPLPEGELEYEKLFISFSYDKGESFTQKYEMTSKDYKLSPEGDNEEYFLRFFKEKRIKNIREIVKEEEESEIIEESESEENDKNRSDDKYEEDGKIETGSELDKENNKELDEKPEEPKIEYVVDITTVHETSKIFHICFDLSAPEIDIDNSSLLDSWTNSPINAVFNINEGISAVSRVVIASPQKILYEYHQADLKEKELSINSLLDEEAKDDSGTTITVTAMDLSGNISEKSYTYYLDVIAPKLTFNLPDNALITNSDVGVSIIAEDNIMSTASLYVNIVKKNRGKSIVYLDKKIDGSEDNLSFEDILKEDGEYELIAYAKDLAGNESERISTQFRIDKTSPVVEISGFEYGKDYRQNVNVNINSYDEFFADSKVHIKVTKIRPKETTIDNDDILVPLYETFQRSFTLAEDGDYIIFAEMTDKAGNYSSIEKNVRVDKTPPDLSIFGMTDKQISKGIPNLIASLNELFYDSTKVSLEGYVKNAYGTYEKVMTESLSMSDEHFEAPFIINKEGEYLISLTARDRAGNESYKSIEFVYDCTSPYIGWIQNYNKKYITSMTFPKGFSENIKDMTKTSYIAYINARDLEEGTVIKKDGKYVLRIIASDAAGNISDEAVEFIIDNTAPKIVAKGINSSRKVKTGDVVEFSLYDKDDVFTKCTYNGQDVLSEDKICRIRIEGEGQQEIALKAVDLAGNETEKIICLSASVFAMPKSAEKAIESFSKNVTDTLSDNSSLIIDKNTQEKSPIIFISSILGLFLAFLLILGIKSRIDTTK